MTTADSYRRDRRLFRCRCRRRRAQTIAVEPESPMPRPWGVSAEEAVDLCRDWMVYLGAADSVVAVGETRTLCDLYSSRYLAWVHHLRENLDVDLVDRAARLAASDGRYPLVFVRGGVRPVAREKADSLGVGLLEYSARDRALDGANALGRQLCASGLARG